MKSRYLVRPRKKGESTDDKRIQEMIDQVANEATKENLLLGESGTFDLKDLTKKL